MAPRRTCRSVKANNLNDYNSLSLNDVLCPICRSILVEPVTLPCTHGFCFVCFEGTVANASLCCPLCRKRFSSWHRVAKKENKVVNIDLWHAIKTSFPQQLENKLNGREDNFVEETQRRLATPGEIRREYEEQKLKQELELQKKHEAEERASEEYIRKIKEQEDFEAIVRTEKLLLDEQVARELSKQINLQAEASGSEEGASAFRKCRSVRKFPHKVKNQNPKVKINCDETSEKPFTSKVMNKDKKSQCLKTNRSGVSNLKHSSLRKDVATDVSDSNDSIENEYHYFKPIDLKNIPPSKPVTVIKVPTITHSSATVIIRPPGGKITLNHNCLMSAFAKLDISSPNLGVLQNQKPINSSPPTKQRPGRKRKLMNDASTSKNSDVSDNITETPVSKRLKCGKNLKSSQKRNIFGLKRRPRAQKSNGISSTEKKPDKNLTAMYYLDNRPNTRSKQKILNQVYSGEVSLVNNANVSPPFYGFDLRKNRTHEFFISKPAAHSVVVGDLLNRRKLQEESDHALAKKLQEELNSIKYSTRSSIIRNSKSCKRRRQVTLDEIIISRSTVK